MPTFLPRFRLLLLLFLPGFALLAEAAVPAHSVDYYQAAKLGDVARISYWLENGTDVDAKDATGNTALVYASAQGHAQVVRALITQRARLDAIGGQWTALMAAAYHGHRNIVAMLVAAGARLELKNPHGRTALGYAVFNNQQGTVEELLTAGADVNQPLAPQAMSPLILAARKANPQMTALLLAAGADVNYQDAARRSALFYAAIKQHVPTMQLLLEHGANLDQRDANGHTLLTRLARTARPEVFSWLLQQGADVNLSYRDQTPLLIAARAGNSGIVTLLLASTPRQQQTEAFLATIAGGSLKTLQAFLDAGLDIDTADTRGVTGLMAAARHRHKRLVTYLLRKGANIDRQDQEGRTALMYAVDLEPAKPGIVRSLIENGADVSIRDRTGRDALQRLQSRQSASTAAAQLEHLLSSYKNRSDRPFGFLTR